MNEPSKEETPNRDEPTGHVDSEDDSGENGWKGQPEVSGVDPVPPPCSRDFVLALAASIVFVAASVLYVWLEFIGLDYYKKVEDFPDYVLEADDDAIWSEYGWEDDDYLTGLGKDEEFLISHYMVVYFDAALGFVIVGTLEYMRQPGLLPATFIVAGLFGVVSAVFVEWDEWLSNVFNSASVHLFFLEALLLFRRHYKDVDAFLRCIHLFGDFCFIAGTLGDVVLSYYAVWEVFETPHAQAAIGTAFAWLLCSLVYVFVVVQRERDLRGRLALEKGLEN